MRVHGGGGGGGREKIKAPLLLHSMKDTVELFKHGTLILYGQPQNVPV